MLESFCISVLISLKVLLEVSAIAAKSLASSSGALSTITEYDNSPAIVS